MNAQVAIIPVMKMPHVPTLMAATVVTVCLVSMELDSTAQVNIFHAMHNINIVV